MPSHKPTIPYPYTTVVTVEDYLDREKIDRFLTRHFRNYTRQRMQRLIRGGCIWIDDVLAEPRFRVQAGQIVRVRLSEPPDKLLEAQDLPLEILYEDEHVIAVNKPPRQSAHPGGNFHDGTLANAMQFYLDGQTPLPGLLRPGIVHRLDRLTSGVIVVCKDHLAHRNLSIAFQAGQVSKTYLALVHGHVEDDAGEIDAAIGRAPDSMLMSIDPAATARKVATTRFRVLERFELPYALVQAKPLTGRLHQIRVHLSSIGHSIVGDEFYGDCHDESLMDRQALHAAEIAFLHPLTGEPLVISAPLPTDFQQTLDRLRRNCC